MQPNHRCGLQTLCLFTAASAPLTARFISVLNFRPLIWRNSHPSVLADRVEDVTTPELVQDDPTTSRRVVMFGWFSPAPSTITHHTCPPTPPHRARSIAPAPLRLPSATIPSRAIRQLSSGPRHTLPLRWRWNLAAAAHFSHRHEAG